MQILKSKKLMVSLMAVCVVVLLVLVALLRDDTEAINFDTYKELLQTNSIKKAVIDNSEVVLFTKEGKYSIIRDGIDMQELVKKVAVQSVKENPFLQDLLVLGLLFCMVIALVFYARKKREAELKKDKEEKYNAYANAGLTQSVIKPTTSKYKFSDIAGISEVKEELQEVVDFLKNSSEYEKFGITLPRGVLLVGPPGVGKTLIAKAVAGEANVPFFYQSGASFVQIYVGMGAKRVRELFSHAKANAPSIIFIDEIDAVGKARGGVRNDERESTLNELLTQMDGFEDSSGVIVIGATNKKEVIDEALLRSGRFDRRIFIPMPDLSDRVKILSIYLKGKPFEGDVKNIAKMSVGFSGAALATLVNEAAINALREDRETISEDDFVAVRQKVLLGKRRVLNFSDEEKKIQAYYQAAKALCAYWFEIDFDKITIVNDRLKDIDLEIESKTQMYSKIKVYLAGFAITKIKYNETFSNSADDLLRAREIAKSMSELYGMGKGLVPYPDDIANILIEARDEVEKFLLGMNTPLKFIADKLFKDESVSKKEIKKIVDEIF